MFKTALFDCESMKNVSVLTEDRAFDLLFRSHPGGFDSSGIPTPGNLPSKAKKMLMTGGLWAQPELSRNHHLLSKTLKSRLTQVYATVQMVETVTRPGGGGGTLGISGWRCAAGTMEPLTYTRASSAEFC